MSNILQVTGDAQDLSITLASLASGHGRLAAQLNFAAVKAPRFILELALKTGTAPTAGTTYRIYLIRYDDKSTSYASEGFGVADADIGTTEPLNARFLGSIEVANSTNTFFYGDFLVENPGSLWSIVVWNGTNQALNASGHIARYKTLIDQIV